MKMLKMHVLKNNSSISTISKNGFLMFSRIGTCGCRNSDILRLSNRVYEIFQSMRIIEKIVMKIPWKVSYENNKFLFVVDTIVTTDSRLFGSIHVLRHSELIITWLLLLSFGCFALFRKFKCNQLYADRISHV